MIQRDNRRTTVKNQQGFTLLELIVATAIFSVMLAGMVAALIAGQSAWSTTDTKIRLQENLRQTLQRISSELEESGADGNDVPQVVISNGGGASNTDVIRFSIPLCVCGSSPLDGNSNVTYWGAPLTWGMTNCPGESLPVKTNSKVDICHFPPGNPNNPQSLDVAAAAVPAHLSHGDWLGTCAPCSITNNKFIEYRINAGGQLLRRVLNDAAAVVKEEIFAGNISDFQAVLSGDQKMVVLTVSTAANTHQNRQITASYSVNVYLRNRG